MAATPRLIILAPWQKPPRLNSKHTIVWNDNDNIDTLLPGDQAILCATAQQLLASVRLLAMFERCRTAVTIIGPPDDKYDLEAAVHHCGCPITLITSHKPYTVLLERIDYFLSGSSQASS